MAVGVACAGTGMRAATDLLEPLLGDAVDFVRQGALIASALVLMQQPEAKARPRSFTCGPMPCPNEAGRHSQQVICGQAVLHSRFPVFA